MLANQSYIVANPGQYAIQQPGGQMLAETPTPRVNQKYGTVHHDRPLVRGKTSPYGFFVKMCYEEHKKKYPNENVQVTEISKKCSQKWKTMTEDEKKRFYELAQKDAERYQAEVAAYGGEDVLRKRKRAKKDPNAPKRALSAFFFFSNEKRPEVQQSHPEWKVGQVAQELGRFWKALDEDARVIYEKKAQADKERYAEEMSVYRNEMQMVKMSMKQQQQPAVPLQQMAASSSGGSGGGATLGSVLAAGGGPSLLQQHQSPSQSASQSRQNPQQMVIISGSGTGTTSGSGSAAQSGQLPMQILEEHIAMNNV